MWGLRGFTGIGWYKKGYLVKNRGFFYWKDVLGGGSTKGYWEVFINI
jgi:hypothetical protein